MIPGSFSRTDSASGSASSWPYGLSMSMTSRAVLGMPASLARRARGQTGNRAALGALVDRPAVRRPGADAAARDVDDVRRSVAQQKRAGHGTALARGADDRDGPVRVDVVRERVDVVVRDEYRARDVAL